MRFLAYESVCLPIRVPYNCSSKLRDECDTHRNALRIGRHMHFLFVCLSSPSPRLLSLSFSPFFWCVSFDSYPYESYWLRMRCSAIQRDETIIILLMGISKWSISHFKKAGNATHYVMTRMKTVRCVCVWFRIMLYYLFGMFLKWAIVAVNLCGIWSLLCDQKPNEEINCNYEIVYWVHWILLLLLFVVVVVVVLFFRWQYWRHINHIELKRCLIGKSKDRESADK